MTDADMDAWLAQEAEDYLDQGTVGLYLLVWALRGSSFEVSDDEAVALARRVARRLVERGEAAIHLVSWPDLGVVGGPLPLTELDDPASWSEGESGPVAALVPRD